MAMRTTRHPCSSLCRSAFAFRMTDSLFLLLHVLKSECDVLGLLCLIAFAFALEASATVRMSA